MSLKILSVGQRAGELTAGGKGYSTSESSKARDHDVLRPIDPWFTAAVHRSLCDDYELGCHCAMVTTTEAQFVGSSTRWATCIRELGSTTGIGCSISMVATTTTGLGLYTGYDVDCN